MATYAELYELRSNSDLTNKIAVAAVIAAQGKLAGTPSAEEASWAMDVIESPGRTAESIVNLVLAANKTATVAQIESASDTSIQSNVDDVVDGLILGQ